MIGILVLLSFIAAAFGSLIPRLDGKIVGGVQVSIESFPYQVSVRIYDTHICGGSIIDETTILTAAHCVHGMDHTQFSIRAGHTNRNLGQRIPVYEVKPHKYYNPNIINNDVAILKLYQRLRFSSTVQPIELQFKGVEVLSGTKSWVSGWGATQEGSQNIPDLLRAVGVTVVGNSECARKYGAGKISFAMLCAQTLYKDSCQGDSGGPLVANGKLIGVVSWGYGCARPQFPGVYAKVSYFYNWIINNI